MNKISSKYFLMLIGVTILLLSSCGPTEEDLRATDTKIAEEVFSTQTALAPKTTNTYTPNPTSTFTPSPTPNREATVASMSTQEAQSMADLVQQLYDDGYIHTTIGTYSSLTILQKSLARINWVRFYDTKKYLENFVLRSDISWKTAKEGANIKYSGCGFVFGNDGDFENYHIIRLTLNGKITFSRCLNDCSYLSTLASSYFGKIDYMQGNAELILIVEEGTIQAFVDGERAFVRYDQKKLKGYLAYAVGSGTNAGFGTSCTFRNTEIWSLEP